MSNDFIPSTDDGFAHLVVTLGAIVTDPANPLKVPGNLVAQWTAAVANWTPAWGAYQAIQPQYDSLLQAKNAAHDPMAAAIRAVNNVVQANPTVTDAQRAAAQLPVHKTTRTAVGAPQSAPMLVSVDNEHLLQRLWFVDSLTPGSRAKPAGVAFCEIRQAILPPTAPAPTDPEGLAPLATDSKPPHRTDFSADEVGQMSYYAVRWLSTRGAPGPWSAVTGYPVI